MYKHKLIISALLILRIEKEISGFVQGISLASSLKGNIYLSVSRFVTCNRNMTKSSLSKEETVQHAIDFVPTAIL